MSDIHSQQILLREKDLKFQYAYQVILIMETAAW